MPRRKTFTTDIGFVEPISESKQLLFHPDKQIPNENAYIVILLEQFLIVDRSPTGYDSVIGRYYVQQTDTLDFVSISDAYKIDMHVKVKYDENLDGMRFEKAMGPVLIYCGIAGIMMVNPMDGSEELLVNGQCTVHRNSYSHTNFVYYSTYDDVEHSHYVLTYDASQKKVVTKQLDIPIQQVDSLCICRLVSASTPTDLFFADGALTSISFENGFFSFETSTVAPPPGGEIISSACYDQETLYTITIPNRSMLAYCDGAWVSDSSNVPAGMFLSSDCGTVLLKEKKMVSQFRISNIGHNANGICANCFLNMVNGVVVLQSHSQSMYIDCISRQITHFFVANECTSRFVHFNPHGYSVTREEWPSKLTVLDKMGNTVNSTDAFVYEEDICNGIFPHERYIALCGNRVLKTQNEIAFIREPSESAIFTMEGNMFWFADTGIIWAVEFNKNGELVASVSMTMEADDISITVNPHNPQMAVVEYGTFDYEDCTYEEEMVVVIFNETVIKTIAHDSFAFFIGPDAFLDDDGLVRVTEDATTKVGCFETNLYFLWSPEPYTIRAAKKNLMGFDIVLETFEYSQELELLSHTNSIVSLTEVLCEGKHYIHITKKIPDYRDLH
ncbi:hypothetical protein PCE1_003274 [Barthelona sp. PCE]